MKGKREFNTEQKDSIYEYAGRGKSQVAHFHKKIREWTNEYGDIASSGLSSSANNYYDKLNEALIKSQNDVNRLYEAAEQVENEYAKKFGDIDFALGLYVDRINALLSVLQTRGQVADVFAAEGFGVRLVKAKRELDKILNKEILGLLASLSANPENLEKLNLENYDSQAYIDYISAKYRGQDMFDPNDPKRILNIERNLLIMCYEYLHPENAKKMDNFLKPISMGGDHEKEVLDIKYLAYASLEPYQSVFFKYLPKINIRGHHTQGMEYYMLGYLDEKNIYIDIGRVNNIDFTGNPTSDRRGAYATFFHEIGHAVDRLMLEDGYQNSMSINNIVKKDVNSSLRAYIESIEPHLSTEDVQTVLDSLQRGKITTGDTALDLIRTQVRSHYYYNVFSGGANDTASDVYGGVTDNNIIGWWGHYPKGGESYWDTHLPSFEFFANTFSRYLTGYADAITSINRNLEDSSVAFENLINSVK